jgi:hypothetical protein
MIWLIKVTSWDYEGLTLKLSIHQYYLKVVTKDEKNKSDHRMEDKLYK